MSKPREKFRIGNHTALAHFFEYASELVKDKPFVIRIESEKRSIDQNSMIYAVYSEIVKQVEDQTLTDIRRECKLLHGVVILRRDDADFRELYDTGVLRSLSYEQKLRAMDILPVTSRMNKKQATEYVENVIRHYASVGIFIQHPDEKSRNDYPEAQQ
jgi:hypothetical protein